MHSRMLRGALALLIGLSLAGTGLVPRLAAPPAALALDQTISICDFATVSATLADVQADGGGKIAFDCTGTIEFANQLMITSDVTFVGNGDVIFDGRDSTRLFRVTIGSRLALIGLTLQDGSADVGGAIHNIAGTLEITASTFSGNEASSDGGAIHNVGALKITASAFTDNQAGASGGAIYISNGTVEITASTFSGNDADSSGGVIWNSGAMTVRASTFSSNSARASGGAIYSTNSATVITSTFASNSAVTGGAIYNGFLLVSVTASTFSGNSASASGGALFNSQLPSAFDVSATILADSPMGGNCHGGIDPGGSNLSDDDSCGVTQGDANLADLTDNGGPNQTMLPQAPSDAIDAANCADTTDFDQRGAPRPEMGCDIGAVEAGATVPVQIVIAYNLGPILVDRSVQIVVVAYGSAGASLTYEFDCDNNDDFELSQTDDPSATCFFTQAGNNVVPVRVSDGTTSATGQTTVEVLAAIPSIGALMLAPTPSNEGHIVTLSAEFTNPSPLATHTCKIDWDDDTVEPGSVTELDGSGSCAGSHVYTDDDAYTVSVTIIDDDTESDSTSVVQTVVNLPPVIDGITTNAPVPQGQPALVTVTATDPGVNDILIYAFDCDDNGSYETPGDGNLGMCPLDPARASMTIKVLVEDGDGGSDTGSVTVGQTVTLCGNSYTGALSMPMAGGCPGGTTPLALPAPNPTTVCIDPYTGALGWSATGSCTPVQRPHIVPADGPLAYCWHAYTGELRFSWNGQCGPYEQPGVIPG